MDLTVLMGYEADPATVEALRRRLPSGTTVLPPGSEPGEEVSVLVCGRPSRELVLSCPALRYLIIPWAGLPDCTRDLMAGFPEVSVHNLHHNAMSTAEMAIGLLLAAARNIPIADRSLRSGNWHPRYSMDDCFGPLHGRSMLILGYGSVGRRLGRISLSLGMEVTGIRRSGGSDDGPVRVHGPSELHGQLPGADVLALTLPLTRETRGIIGESELALLPKGALLVNVGRGQLVEEEALYRALADHRLGAAGIDVWYRYPGSVQERSETFPSSFPFHLLDNIVMTPHMGGAFGTGSVEDQRLEQLVVTLSAVAEGCDVPFRVDLDRGY